MTWKIQQQQWDSDFFGFDIAKISGNGSVEALLTLMDTLKNEGIRLAYVYPESFLDTNKLISAGLENIYQTTYSTYQCSIPSSGIFPIPEVTEFDITMDIPAIEELAIISGSNARFSKDTNFKQGASGQFYKQWIHNAMDKRFDDILLVHTKEKKVQGIITGRIADNKVVIGLLGVHPDYLHQGVGTRLLLSIQHWASSKKMTQVQVTTQKDNSAAVQLYNKNGFVKIADIEIYHIWL